MSQKRARPHTNFIDRFFAEMHQVSGPVWSTWIARAPSPLDPGRLSHAVARLVGETERLRLAWNPQRREFVPVERSPSRCSAIVKHHTSPCTESELFRTGVDLMADVPLRLHMLPCDGPRGGTALAMQLHHAIGDGRSLLVLTRRLWDHYGDRVDPIHEVRRPPPADQDLLTSLARRALSVFRLAHPRYRLFARRAHALRRDGNDPREPICATVRIPIAGLVKAPLTRAAMFWGAILAAVASHEGRWPCLPIRFRVPVDLRAALGRRNGIGNVTTAIPVEVPPEMLEACANNPQALCRVVPGEIEKLLGHGAQWGSLCEGMVIARCRTPKALARAIQSDLVSTPKTYTLNATYMGCLDKYVAGAPVDTSSVQCHSPLWGVIGYTMGNELFINITTFNGIWSWPALYGFVGHMLRWFARSFGVEGAVVSALDRYQTAAMCG